MITGGISCAAESRSFAPSILFQDITSSMATVTVVATMRSQIVWKCRRDKIRFLVILFVENINQLMLPEYERGLVSPPPTPFLASVPIATLEDTYSVGRDPSSD